MIGCNSDLVERFTLSTIYVEEGSLSLSATASNADEKIRFASDKFKRS